MIRETRFSVPASPAGVLLRKVSFMVNLRQPRDVAQILLSVLFLALAKWCLDYLERRAREDAKLTVRWE